MSVIPHINGWDVSEIVMGFPQPCSLCHKLAQRSLHLQRSSSHHEMQYYCCFDDDCLNEMYIYLREV